MGEYPNGYDTSAHNHPTVKVETGPATTLLRWWDLEDEY